MSMHKIPITDIEREGLEKHGLGRSIGKPSQLSDAFRLGVKWGHDRERESCAKACEEVRDDCWSGSKEYDTAARCVEAIRSQGIEQST